MYGDGLIPCIVMPYYKYSILQYLSFKRLLGSGKAAKRVFFFLVELTHLSSSNGPVSGSNSTARKCEGNILKKLCFLRDLRPMMKSHDEDGLMRTENLIKENPLVCE